MKPVLLLVPLLLLLEGCGSSGRSNQPAWGPVVSREIDTLGSQNWIIIADASFPVVSRRGVRTVLVEAEIPELVDFVVNDLERSENVKPTFNTARELPFLSNDWAPGIDQFRKQLKSALHGHQVREMDYRSLSLVAQSESSNFVVLVLKSRTSLPYSSVFVELDSGYWDRDLEKGLRGEIRQAKEKAERERDNNEANTGGN
jgi:hypothetical protein